MTREHPDELTPREREVLDLVRLGLTNEEIAARLGISLDGAKYHVSQILSKLGVTTREEAAAVTPAPRRRWWAALPLAVKAASVAVVLAAVGGLGLLAWGVFQMSGDEENALVGGTTGPILSEDSAIDVAEQYMTATYGGANSCSSANVNPSSRMWSVGCYHASGDDCEGITQGTGECSVFDVVRVSARRVLVDPSTGTASERSTPVSVAGPVIAAVRNYLSTTRLDDQEYDLPPPYFCGWFSNPTPSPPVVCLDTRTLFSESSADVEMLSQDGGRWSLTVERRGEEWAVTVVKRLGQDTGPRIGDHWHAPYQFFACGEKQPNAPVWESGVHTHGDGILHIHPFQAFEEGPGARLVKWFEYGGGLLAETEIKIPGSQETFRNGDLCPDGEPGELQVFVTHVGEASEERLEGDALMQYIPHDGDRIRIVFGPPEEPVVSTAEPTFATPTPADPPPTTVPPRP